MLGEKMYVVACYEPCGNQPECFAENVLAYELPVLLPHEKLLNRKFHSMPVIRQRKVHFENETIGTTEYENMALMKYEAKRQQSVEKVVPTKDMPIKVRLSTSKSDIQLSSRSSLHKRSKGGDYRQGYADFLFLLEFVECHNQLRAKHGSPPLRYNQQISENAAQWAQHLADQQLFEYDRSHQFGQNIFKARLDFLGGATPVQFWYAEMENYNFWQPQFKRECAHFTQLIWKSTTDLGLGVAKRADTIYVVANYSPKGNYFEAFQENVPPLLMDGNCGLKGPHLAASSRERKKWTQTSLNENKQFDRDILEAHNKYRAKHGAPELQMSSQLVAYARTLAQRFAASGVAVHQIEQDLAISSYASENNNITARGLVKYWYQELKDYNFDNPSSSNFADHFMQMISPLVEQLGVGRARKGKVTYIVVLYYPWKNEIEFSTNQILPPLKNKKPSLLETLERAYKNLVFPSDSAKKTC